MTTKPKQKIFLIIGIDRTGVTDIGVGELQQVLRSFKNYSRDLDGAQLPTHEKAKLIKEMVDNPGQSTRLKSNLEDDEQVLAINITGLKLRPGVALY